MYLTDHKNYKSYRKSVRNGYNPAIIIIIAVNEHIHTYVICLRILLHYSIYYWE